MTKQGPIPSGEMWGLGPCLRAQQLDSSYWGYTGAWKPLLRKRHVQNRVKFARNTLIGPKRNGLTFCGLMRVKWFFSGLVVDSASPRYWIKATVHCKDNEAACRKNQGMFFILRCCIPRIMDQFEYIQNILRDYIAVCWRGNGCFNKTTTPNTRVSEQHLGSRKKGLMYWSWPIDNLWGDIKNSVSTQNPKIHRNCGM